MALQVHTDPGTTLMIGKAAAANTGAGMAGMTVTADFGSFSDTVTWTKTGLTSGRTGLGSVKGWSLRQDGDTFTRAWTLTNQTGQNLRSLVIDGLPGATIFDLTDPSPGTAHSGAGKTFTPTPPGNPNLDIVVTYRDRVQLLTSNPAAGDLFRRMEIAFTKNGPFTSGSRMTFLADTDQIEIGHIPSHD